MSEKEARSIKLPASSKDVLWTPREERVKQSQMTAFAAEVQRSRGRQFADYDDLWSWSVAELEEFWGDVWCFYNLGSTPYVEVLSGDGMPGAAWFRGAKLNFAAEAMRWSSEQPALIAVSESGTTRQVRRDELRLLVGSVAESLREAGIGPGDRVVAYLPNGVEAIVAFLACASIGAIWSVCAQDGGLDYALSRFAQLEPRVLIASDGYQYGGAVRSRSDVVEGLIVGLPTLELLIRVPGPEEADISPLGAAITTARVMQWAEAIGNPREFDPIPMPANAPLWVVFSSGTTGKPKGIVHSHGGAAVVGVCQFGLHFDLGPGDRFFWYTTTSWIMWNSLLNALLVGATAVLYDGNPAWPTQDRLWQVAAETRASVMGASPAYMLACQKQELRPGDTYDLRSLTGVGCTGAPTPESVYRWIYSAVSPDVTMHVISGGTDFAAALLMGAPWLPVTAGEMACRSLGVHVESWDELGKPVRDQVGELVVLKPMPSMPLEIWGDKDFERYRSAYFDTYPGVWRHGDWITLSSHGTAFVHGRSDSTLNRNGVRMGSADLYAAVEAIPVVAEALVLGVELANSGYWLPMFVRLNDGAILDDVLIDLIERTVRTQVSPRHVPDEIVQVLRIPHTLTGKKLEVPLKRLAQGAELDQVVGLSSVDSPEAVHWFIDFFRSHPAVASAGPT